MFTGIIEEVGKIIEVRKDTHAWKIAANFASELSEGDSICVDGVCVSVRSCNDIFFTADIHEGTLLKTTFQWIQEGTRVNLERALPADARFNGHLVQGHVDGVGKIISFSQEAEHKVLEISLPEDLERACVREGSIALNGISLTIAALHHRILSINVIPHTFDHTSIADVTVGSFMNVECDILGRYMEKFSRLAPTVQISADRTPQHERAAQAIEAVRRGEMIIIVDDSHREDEGDFFKPAADIRGEDINFMARYGRGLICLAIERERAAELDLIPMTAKNTALHRTAFTESIDAVNGTTTGISTEERAHTIRKVLDRDAKAEDFARPGHVFPIVASPQGLSVRRGHTEAAVMLSKEVGSEAAGVICEILKEDGSMARWNDLLVLARSLSMALVTVGDLVFYGAQQKEQT